MGRGGGGGLISLCGSLFDFNSITMRKIIRGPCVYKPAMWDSAPLLVSIAFNCML